MAPRLHIYVPPHPTITHWLTVARDRHTPVPLFRTALAEMGRWLAYEALREWLPVRDVVVETPLASCPGKAIDIDQPLAIVPILRAGLVLLESCHALVPSAAVYHVGFARDETTLAPNCYLNKLPTTFAPQTRVLITEPMLATGGTAIATLEMLVARGIAPANIRIINIICAPPALQRLDRAFPELQIYSAAIDEHLDERGFIVPGLGDAGDRAFGTLA